MDQPGLLRVEKTRRLTRRALFAVPLVAGARGLAQQTPAEAGRIVAIGDIHGDSDALAAVLRMAEVIDDKGAWSGGTTRVVQIGDIPARGPNARKAYDHLMALEQQAEAAGGKLHFLIGNHDAGVMYGDLRSIIPEEYESFRTPDSESTLVALYEKYVAEAKEHNAYPASAAEQENFRKDWFDRHPPGFAEHREAFSAGGKYGSWIRKHDSVLILNGTLFVHGGISPKFVSAKPAALNEKIRTELADPSKLPPGLTTDIEGPLWYRGMAEGDEKQLLPHVQAVLKSYGVRRIVIGHSVTRTVILPRFGSAVVDIDIGLSKFYGRPPAFLVLEGTTATVVHNGKKLPLPGPAKQELLAYLRAVAEADPAPEVVQKAIDKVTK